MEHEEQIKKICEKFFTTEDMSIEQAIKEGFELGKQEGIRMAVALKKYQCELSHEDYKEAVLIEDIITLNSLIKKEE